MTTIVVSAVNLRKGGTLTILRDCLKYLSTLRSKDESEYKVIVLVHKKELADYPGIEYIEIPWSIKSWVHRLWCEYMTMFQISKRIGNIDLWFSLHDTTPRVQAKSQAVYCQTSFPFFKWSWRDFRFDYKIPLFAIFTRYAYQTNIRRNRFLIVQQEWLRLGFSRMFGLPQDRFIVAPPERKSYSAEVSAPIRSTSPVQFIFPATPDCHKNIETLCRAASELEGEIGKGKFTVLLTISGEENKYARWIHQKWGSISSIKFAGYMSQQRLYEYYQESDCLVFPSRVETWGLPISEFIPFGRPLLLADLPYAHETAQGASHVAFFPATSPTALKEMMRRVVEGDHRFLSPVAYKTISAPSASSWEELFKILLTHP